MGIDPSLLTQFTRFQTFALSNKDNAIAARAGDGGLDIQPKKTIDFIGNIGRTPASKAQNRYVRYLFNDTIKGMFNVSDMRDLPEPVLAAMKHEDTTTGKPLTARRIRAVVTVVQAFISDADEIRGNLAAAGLHGVGDDAIRAALGACGRDADAVQFLKDHVGMFFCDDKGEQRSAAEVKDKVASLVANFADLRKAANGDKAVFDAGKAFLEANLVDPAMLVSIFGDMAKAAGEIKIDVKGFAPSAPAPEMYKAVKQFNASLDSVSRRLAEQFTARAQVFTGSEKAVNTLSLRTFLVTAALARHGDAFVRKMQETYESKSMRDLLGMYYNLGYNASVGDLLFDGDVDLFEPRANDKEVARLAYMPADKEKQAAVIRRLMQHDRDNPSPVFRLAQSAVANMFCLERGFRLRNAATGASSPDVLGAKFVRTDVGTESRPRHVGNHLDLNDEVAYAVQKDFLLRAYALVFGSETTEYESIREKIVMAAMGD
ncbi:MAG: hypothetical protein IJI36_02315 [Kiritimatiellae bacterium]|nr:hypothetical protein [Kiritimatiellia bacterium]